MCDLKGHGLAVGLREPRGKAYSRKRWFAIEHFPGAQAEPPKRKKPVSVTLRADAPTVGGAPAPTQCPGFTGAHRYAFTPTPGWRGEITRDWLEQRAEGA